MRFCVLGPLDVSSAGGALPLGTRKQRSVLALLAVSAGRVVLLDELVDELWPAGPPASAVPNVRGYVGELRRLLASVEPGRDRLVRHGSGYVLYAGAEELDLSVFTAKVEAGREALRRNDHTAGAARFGEALACWRGPMLAGVPRGPMLTARCAATEGERATVAEELAQILLRLDEPGDAVGLLREHVLEHPVREPGYLLLVRALYRLNDVAGALAAYAEIRTTLRERLGVDPGPELEDLHRAILNREEMAEPALPLPTIATAAPRPTGAVPAQLPLDVRGFTGRTQELTALDSILAAAGEQPTAVVVSAIAGTAGVGKTALALHWAHRVREEFPDGQLYVNLRGFDPSGSVVTPAEAIHNFLDALGVPPEQIPADLDARAGLYRGLLSSRRAMVVLDNARDAEQVRPLLPGSSGCLAMVTSRDQLTGLVAAEGAHPLYLDLLSTAEARTLLERRLGTARVAAEASATDEIIARCARLPLALAVVAARATTRPNVPLAAVAAELGDARTNLDALDAGDLATNVRAVLSWSYRSLSPEAARLFRQLGLHAGPDISAPAAASLAGAPIGQVRRLLAELIRAHLVTEHAPDRFWFHDLLRAYATDLAHSHDGPEDRHAALGRVLDHYLHTAYAAALLLYPHRDPIMLAPQHPGTSTEELSDDAQAQAWLTAEHQVLVASVYHAADAGFGQHAWQLAWTLVDFLQRLGHWDEQIATQEAALKAAQRQADRLGESRSHGALARASAHLGQCGKARTHYDEALRLLTELGDTTGRIQVHRGLAWVGHLDGNLIDSLDHGHRVLELSEAAHNRSGQADALNSIGYAHTLLSDHEKGILYCERALELYQELDDRSGQADTWDSLGYAHHHLGRYDRAATCYRRALDLYRHIGHRYYEATTLSRLGDTHSALDDIGAASDAWRGAMDILDQLGHPDADGVRAKLARS